MNLAYDSFVTLKSKFSSFVTMYKYPIGIQDFGTIRADGFLYIDKTYFIHKLIDSGLKLPKGKILIS